MKSYPLFIVILLAAVLLAACGQPSAAAAPAVAAVSAQTTPSLAAPTSTPTATLQPAQPPTDTPEPSATLEPSATIEPSPTACTNAAEFVQNVSLADNVTIAADKSFVKIWRIRNTGTCTWTTDYRFAYVSGEQFSSPLLVAMPTHVAPGETIDFRLDLFAPSKMGPYAATWMLKAPDGALFGLGPDSSQPLKVMINVRRPTPEPNG